ncbi:phenylacetate--CoA ligase family protein [Gottfriedia acidiceleris]|uniref:phenylacetate--CoA ligase family protein n=1 Tax=Gottfriedia acidiceleris TaxID=371036 RepID=UPI00101CC67D|nr:phenylacetate--CoA ligase family protein [Gottfriedia acidiceleris]
MNASIIKSIEEKTPDFIKKIITPIVRKKVINNKYFLEQYKAITDFDKKTEKQKDEIHFNLLKEKIIYAYENTIYYKNLLDKIDFNPYNMTNLEEILKIPSISKDEVINNFEELTSNEAINTYTAYTGGSTGKPLKILLDGTAPYKERAFIYKYWEKAVGYSYKKGKTITFRGLEFGKRLYKFNPIDNQIIMSPFKLSLDTIDDYVKVIRSYKPEFIHGYPSAISNFCRLINLKKIKLDIEIKGVFLVSENVTEIEKELIENTLKCKTAIFYGHSERLVLGEYYENLGYKFHKLYGHVELMHYKDNLYKILVTGFLSNSMPLINYITDDIVEITENKECLIHGHRGKELLYGVNKEEISLAAINFHSNAFSKVLKYQFEQHEIGNVKFRLEPIKGMQFENKDLNQIKKVLDNKFNNVINYSIEIVDYIPLTQRGKFKKIIQHIN